MIYFEDLKKVNKKLNINYKNLFDKFLNNGNYILGNNLSQFEKKFSILNKSNYTIGCGSGYDALFISLKSLNLPKNSEVIISSNSYIAAIFAIINADLKPVFVEPDINTYNIDANLIEKKITNKTKCLIPVHLYGLMSDMKKIRKIANKYKLIIIDDCAQSLGSTLDLKTSHFYSDFSAHSFYPTKNLGAMGDGGAINVSKKKYYEKIIKLRNYGFRKKNYADLVGVNSRLDEFQAMILLKKLFKLSKFIKYKKKLARIYNNELNSNFIKTVFPKNFNHTYHLYVIRNENRAKLTKFLQKNRIQYSIHYPIPPQGQKALKKYINDDYPISKKIHKTILTLPLSYSHTEKEIMNVSKILNSF